MGADRPALTGDVSGALPTTLTFDNGAGFNDYFEGFTFGSTLLFNVSLFGPALSGPDMTSTSGSTFAFSMFSDQQGTMPVLTTDMTNGFAFTIDINLDGTPSTAIAEALAAKDIPFVISSGYDPQNVSREYRDRPFLQKPFSAEDLESALKKALR